MWARWSAGGECKGSAAVADVGQSGCGARFGEVKGDMPRAPGFLFVGDDFAKVGHVLLDSGDLLWPGTGALVGHAGSVLSLRFGERFGHVLQFLFERGAGHRRKNIT